ncbi:MAG TPA: hypothetical protein VFQ45_03810 [Longimicrobium sp.]|nr:hypothetical protein [Longimicrobium sp.]
MNGLSVPAVDRLLAAAGSAARAVAALDAPAARLAPLARELDALELLADASLLPLARGLDLGAVLSRAVERTASAPGRASIPAPHPRLPSRRAADVVAEEDRRRPLGTEDQAHHPSRRVDGSPPAFPAEARAIPSILSTLPGDADPSRAAAPAPGEAAARASASPPLAHDGDAVERLLTHYADGDAHRPASRSSGGERGDAHRPARGADAGERAEGRGPARVAAHHGSHNRVTSGVMDGAAADAGDRGRRRSIAAGPTCEQAMDVLRERVERAEAAGALDTPVAIVAAAPEVAAVLEDAGNPSAGVTSRASLARAAAEPTSPWADAPDATGPRLLQALERVKAARAARSPAAEPHAPRGPVGIGWEWQDAEGGAPRDAPLPAPEPPRVGTVGGLRGLAARAEAAGQVVPAREAPYPSAGGEAYAGVVAGRLEEAELGERISRLLRREALRQGIDVEGVAP